MRLSIKLNSLLENKKPFCGKMLARTGRFFAILFGLDFWHTVCFEGRAGKPKFEVEKLSVMFRTW